MQTIGKTLQRTFRSQIRAYPLIRAVALISCALLYSATASALEVSAPTVSNGTYEVTFSGCANAGPSVYCGLEERIGDNGSWTSVGGTGTGSVSFTGKPEGFYYYRAHELFFEMDDIYGEGEPTPITEDDYSDEAQVIVTFGEISEPDALEVQLQYEYETRVGDLNADGLDDILVHRLTSPNESNGAVATIILRQTANGDFDSVVPSSAQLATAQTWQIANTDIEVVDVNMDGFVDLHIGNLESSIAGSLNQFVFSSGQILVPQPLDDVGVDDNFKQFVSDIQQWNSDHNYFDDNAVYVEEPGHWEYYWECSFYFWGDSPELECESWYEWEDGDEYWSYAHFNQDAVEFADAMEEAEALGGLTEGSVQDQILTGIFNGLFGDVALANMWGGVIVTYPPVSDTTADTPWWRILTRQLLLLLMLQMEGSTPPDSNLYRVVGPNEYASVIACHCFQTVAGQQDIKQFWKNPVDAVWYAEEGVRIFYPDGVITKLRYLLKIRVPKTVIATGFHGLEPGTVFGWVSFDGASLAALNAALVTRPISLISVFPAD